MNALLHDIQFIHDSQSVTLSILPFESISNNHLIQKLPYNSHNLHWVQGIKT